MIDTGEIKKDCVLFKSTSIIDGCKGLNRLYCEIEDKYCKFYKPKEEEKEQNDEANNTKEG